MSRGFLGCANCYTVFHREIEEILPQMQVSSKHKGKVVPDKDMTKEEHIIWLKGEMNRASSAQDFVGAKRYYDEIVKLGGKA
jgi:protein-arginine kinase activator protein McsA